ncbi:MAG: carboxymuconolactone decarboxylase family protein [Halobacteria archaeon]|nr:carboxymuconolactone decarboxylase family protein [Halobacteria archaeon]
MASDSHSDGGDRDGDETTIEDLIETVEDLERQGRELPDMEDLYSQVSESLAKFGETSPDEMAAFGEFLGEVETEGALSTKHKELTAVSLSVVTHCKWCIAYHVKNAVEEGAIPDEIREAGWMAVLMGGGPALMYYQLVEKAVDEMA